ncbi:MAG: DUF3859 domain-containing protein [Porticoccaceae bacterium]|uniref:DUF3859 domain-containing protein n=1 Tax=Pseudoalteromonas TaxID=53246 RepID=UPI0015FEFE16|nr:MULTISPECIES: DUF3859 domain-containing protein [unclassified Pseudoalteromonas]MBB1302952.1 DUF3859 domain-containing protein [Pseudoalteromonas sp. SR44-8]MBB1418943.1 DUF3859 domain-containing protein [Pseudoalteromonas sp. SG44-1]MBB1435068.1 DUF3859 domain-containing protein [Pseudoalteromonas sp. SG43-6]
MKFNVVVGLFFLLISMFTCGVTVDQSPIKSQVLDYAYVAKIGGKLVQDNTRVSNFVNEDYEIKVLKEKTWVIPAKLGTGFYIVVGFGYIPSSVQHFDLQINYPEITLPSGEKKSSIYRQIDVSGHDGTFVWPFDYYFDLDYEVVPGKWDIRVFSEGNLIHSSDFTVIDSE